MDEPVRTESEIEREVSNGISRDDLIAHNADLALQLGKMRRTMEAMGLGWNEQGHEAGALRQEINRLSRLVQRQAAEIEVLTGMLQDHPVAKYVKDLEAHTKEVEDRYLSVISSPSWRAMSPFRAIIRRLIRKEEPPRVRPKFDHASD